MVNRMQTGPGDIPVSRRLAALISQKPVTGGDLECAAVLLLDALANIIAGRNSDPGRVLLKWAAAQNPDAANRPDAGRLAFLYGGLCHILEMDDLHRASVVHPGCAVVPAVLALVARDARLGRDGKRVLGAVLKGFEAATRVGMAVGAAHYRIWHNTATCGPFGSAMAAADLLGLDTRQTAHALANAGTQSAGLWEFIETGAMTKHLHAARAAEAGLVAAQLAAHGFTGAERIFEGERGFFAAMCPDGAPGAVVARPGDGWQAHQTSLKPWPSCRHTHPTIDCAGSIRDSLNGPEQSLDAIAGIEVRTYQAALDLCDRPHPQGGYEARFSLQHCAAAALTLGPVDLSAFDPAMIKALEPLRARVSLTHDPALQRAYPRHWGGGVRVTFRSGEILEHRCADALGDPDAALDRAALLAKAGSLMRHGGVKDCDRLITQVLEMTDGAPAPRLAF